MGLPPSHLLQVIALVLSLKFPRVPPARPTGTPASFHHGALCFLEASPPTLASGVSLFHPSFSAQTSPPHGGHPCLNIYSSPVATPQEPPHPGASLPQEPPPAPGASLCRSLSRHLLCLRPFSQSTYCHLTYCVHLLVTYSLLIWLLFISLLCRMPALRGRDLSMVHPGT